MPPKVIVIDDSATVREQVSIVLAAEGYEIVEAEDGVEGANAIRLNPTAALAICDFNMPNGSGLELLQLLKERGDSVPVLMLTTEGRADLIERARAFGAKGWMVKPFKPGMLLVTVKKLARAACHLRELPRKPPSAGAPR